MLRVNLEMNSAQHLVYFWFEIFMQFQGNLKIIIIINPEYFVILHLKSFYPVILLSNLISNFDI